MEVKILKIKQGFKKQKMSLLKSLSRFWNVTLGPDYPDEVEIKSDGTIEMEELQESLRRVEEIEKKLNSTNGNAGKGGKSSKSKVVETVTIDPKALEKMAEKAAQKQEQEHDDLVR